MLIQNLAARVPDRAPVRAAAAATVRGLVEALATLGDISGCLELSRVARFLPRLAHHERFALRVFACEMAAELIPLWVSCPLRLPGPPTGPAARGALPVCPVSERRCGRAR